MVSIKDIIFDKLRKYYPDNLRVALIKRVEESI
jgi:hypothetical protein